MVRLSLRGYNGHAIGVGLGEVALWSPYFDILCGL